MVSSESESALSLLEQLRALHGDALADSLRDFCDDAAAPSSSSSSENEGRFDFLDEDVPSQVGALEVLAPEAYWVRAERLLRGVRGELGTLYGPLTAILTLALVHEREGERVSRFVAPLWLVGALCGLSRDRVEEVLHEHASLLARFCYRRAWATNYAPVGKPDREVRSRWAGQLFAVPLPDRPYETSRLGEGPVLGWRALFRAERYRDLARDVHRRFTDAGWRKRFPRERARYGVSRDPGLPTGSRLVLLEWVVAERFGRAAVVAAREREEVRLSSTHEVLSALREGPGVGRDGVGVWARAVASGLARLLGDASRERVWLSVCWAAWRVSRAGLADGFALLHEAAFETLVRRADLVSRSSSGRGATFNWVLNSLGLRALDREARRLLSGVRSAA